MEPKIKGKAFDYDDTRDRKFYDALVWMFHPLAKIIFKTQFIGRENVPKTGSLIIASNHRNSYDPGLIAAARVRKIHYMAKLELFNITRFTSWLLRHLNAFPISRGTGDQRSLNYAIRLIEEGKVLGIFPEGTRSKDPNGKMLPPKAGVALIAKATHSDILPACIYFEGKSKFRKKMTIRFGEVIPYEDLGLTDESNMGEIKEASRFIMGKIGELLEKGHEKD